jgi:hypothetical protein
LPYSPLNRRQAAGRLGGVEENSPVTAARSSGGLLDDVVAWWTQSSRGAAATGRRSLPRGHWHSLARNYRKIVLEIFSNVEITIYLEE